MSNQGFQGFSEPAGSILDNRGRLIVQRNGAQQGAESTIDFEDTATLVWTVTEDGPNLRIQVSGTASGSGGGAMTQLALITTFGSTTVDISSIAGTYNSLLLKWYLRTTSGNSEDEIDLRFNGDNGSHYDWVELRGSTGAASSTGNTATTSSRIGVVPGGADTSTRFGAGSIDIPNYANTANWKTGMVQSTRPSQPFAVASMFSWRQIAAINEITILAASGNFAAGSLVALYGIN